MSQPVKPPRKRLLVIHRGTQIGSPEGHQVRGFLMYRDEIRDRLGLDVAMVPALTLDEAERAYAENPSDVALIMISWRETPDDASAFFRRLWERPDRGKIVFLDSYDPTSTPHFGVLPYVDRYAKRQLLRDLSLYQNDYDGGLVFTDYLSKQRGYDLGDWYFGSKPDPAHAGKIRLCWNMAVIPKYARVLALTRRLSPAWNRRPIALNARFGRVDPADRVGWYLQTRGDAADKLVGLRARHRSTSHRPLSPKKYLLEMMLSKIVVSPFGWGEICFRDYEAVAAGALLVKPSMEHLASRPDIFRAHETYVPIRWDFGDVEEVCEYYLSHPSEARRIVENAQRVMHEYYTKGGFLDDVRSIVEFPDAGPPASGMGPRAA